MGLGKVIFYPLLAPLHILGGLARGAYGGFTNRTGTELASNILWPSMETFGNGVQEYTKTGVHNLIGKGLEELGGTDGFLENLRGFTSNLFRNTQAAFGENSGSLSKVINGIRGSNGVAFLALTGAFALFSALTAFRVIGSENKETDLASLGWSTDIVQSENFHKFRLGCGLTMLGSLLLLPVAPLATGIGVALGGLGAGAASLYRKTHSLEGISGWVRDPNLAPWYIRPFLKLLNPYYMTSGMF